MGRTLLDKIWDAHTVRVEDGGRCVLYIDRQYIHEVTSPVAFAGIERRGFGVARPAQITATADHNIPTVDQHLPIGEPESRRQVETLAENCARHGIEHFGVGHPKQGIVHIIGPELGRNGLRQPVHPPDQTPHDAHYGRRRAASGRRGQGCHPLYHLETHRFGRHGPFHRVCRQHDPFALDGGPHDGLQHEHRVRRARRHDRPRREDLRIPPGPRTRSAGSRLRRGCGPLAGTLQRCGRGFRQGVPRTSPR